MKDYENKSNKYTELIGQIDIGFNINEILGDDVEEKIIDVTGAELHPGEPERCQGNGQHPDFECCCDECDYLKLCVK